MSTFDPELWAGYLAWQRELVQRYINTIRQDPIPKDEAHRLMVRLNDVTSQIRRYEREAR